MKAVILVAGCASQLRPFLTDRPKSLLAVAGIPILRRAITSLAAAGVTEFVVCTGYLDHMIRDAIADWFPDLAVRYAHNPNYDTTGNAVSLGLALPLVDGAPFFLVDGDVVFDTAVIHRLIRHGADSLAVRYDHRFVPEEMKIATDPTGRLTAIGKDLAEGMATGESVGIAWLSRHTGARLTAALEAVAVEEYYEAAFRRCIGEGVVLRGVALGKTFAMEIDTFEDLSAATGRCLAAELGSGVEAATTYHALDRVLVG